MAEKTAYSIMESVQVIEALRQPGVELGTLANKIEQMLLQPKPQVWLFILVMRSLYYKPILFGKIHICIYIMISIIMV